MDTAAENNLAQPLKLLARSRTDKEAWELLFRRWWPFVMAQNYRAFRGQREAAQDASQEVFYRVMRYCDFKNLQEPKAFRAYLYKVSKNVMHDYLLRLKQREHLSLVELDGQSRSPEAQISTLEEIAGLKELLDDILGKLDQQDRELLNLLIQGYSLAEISQQLGIKYSNAGVRIHRLRRRLRNYLKDREFPGF